MTPFLFGIKRKLIDKRNWALWRELNAVQTIRIEEHSKSYYEVYTLQDISIINVQKKNLCPASFTHELLHIKLYKAKVRLGATIKAYLQRKKRLSTLLSSELIDFLADPLDHIKMLPLYLNMGFERELFISDYTLNKADPRKLLLIQQHFRLGNNYSRMFFDEYIGRYFAVMGCPNNTVDYTEPLQTLQAIAPDLFDILERFMAKWRAYDYTDPNPVLSDYRPFLCGFVDELEAWTVDKLFV